MIFTGWFSCRGVTAAAHRPGRVSFVYKPELSAVNGLTVKILTVSGPPLFGVIAAYTLVLAWRPTCNPSGMLDRLGGSLERYMDLLSVRQRLIASNIANADTPDYRTRDIDFNGQISAMLDGAEPHVSEAAGLPVKNDGNNVSLDREARLLAENALRFSMASNLMRIQIRMTRAAIQEGRNG